MYESINIEGKFCGQEVSSELAYEIQRVKQQITHNAKKDSLNYLFVTDMHIDTTQSTGNYELILDTLKYACFIANTTEEIDFLVLGGDCITGWFDKARAKDGIEAVVNSAKECKKPVISVCGNHDNNSNPTTKENPLEQFTKLELRNLMLEPFENSGYVYDGEIGDGLYYYVDLPQKNTRIICLDVFADSKTIIREEKWLAEKALNIKDKNWKYILVLHMPIDERYDVDGMAFLSADMKEILKAFNSKTVAGCSFGEYDFSTYESRIVATSSGHCHNSVIEFNSDYGVFVSLTGCSGVVGKGQFKNILPDDVPDGSRFNMDNSRKNRYLFDAFSVTDDSFSRFRFGNGADKNINRE